MKMFVTLVLRIDDGKLVHCSALDMEQTSAEEVIKEVRFAVNNVSHGNVLAAAVETTLRRHPTTGDATKGRFIGAEANGTQLVVIDRQVMTAAVTEPSEG
jgi:hypothetical protein